MNLLLVDDDDDSRSSVADFLRELGHEVVECGSGREGLQRFVAGDFQLVLSDIRMPGMSGLELLRELTGLPDRGDLEVVIFTGFGDLETAVEALRGGAYDYLLKPINVEELALITERIAERQLLRRENRTLTERFEEEVRAATEEARQELSSLKKAFYKSVGLGEIVVLSEAMKKVFDQAGRLHADRGVPVLIQGETGTGKEVVARYIHYGPGNNTGPFIDINCAAITPNIFESELFGYDPGAYTGGLSRGQKGKLDLAQGGTIFLDEIGDIPVDLQAKLLRVIQEKEYYRVGGLKKVKAEARLICATNANLQERVAAGTFRQDLYYRLNVGCIHLPPLRERREEIIPLALMFLRRLAGEKGKPFNSISPEAAGILQSYQWPGNIRQLKNTIEWAVLMWEDVELKPGHLGILSGSAAPGPTSCAQGSMLDWENFSLPPGGLPLEEFTNRIILKALELNKGIKTETAKYLGITRRSLYSRLDRLENKEP